MRYPRIYRRDPLEGCTSKILNSHSLTWQDCSLSEIVFLFILWNQTVMDLLNHCFFVLQLNEENKLYKSSVMVTAGANQVMIVQIIEFFYNNESKLARMASLSCSITYLLDILSFIGLEVQRKNSVNACIYYQLSFWNTSLCWLSSYGKM